MNLPQRQAAVFLDWQSIDCDDLDLSDIHNLVDLQVMDRCTPDQVPVHAADAEIIIVNKVVLDRSILQQLPNLKLICVIATGTNNIDIATATGMGIKVCNVRDYAAASVSQHVFMLILALSGNFLQYQSDIKQGLWQAQSQFCLLTHPMRELHGKSIGLIGYGHIARAVHRIAEAYGLRVLIANSLSSPDAHQEGRVPLKRLLQEADIVSLHCPLSDLSRNLITAEQFEWMKPDSIIINAARGGIINESDLLDALHQGRIAGAGIDCLQTEPPRANDAMINAGLPNLIITPHNAWGAIEARQRLVDGTANNIQAYLNNVLDTPGHPSSVSP